MPEKSLTIATYAAGASLAAITLVYVFAPTYLIDSDSNSARKKGVVGLSNPANDCFINSVLQALAGLTDLRIYLIREVHRRSIDQPWVYEEVVEDPARKSNPEWKNQSLQSGIVTKGLKNILDALNERPIYRKTISAASFVRVLETAFRQRISRQQQDAQEFLQIVAERLCDEYHAGRRARQAARSKDTSLRAISRNSASPVDGDAIQERLQSLALDADAADNETDDGSSTRIVPTIQTAPPTDDGAEEEGFPMEGAYESQIECKVCGFRTKAVQSTFCTLTLTVPQTKSSSLNTCLDGFFKTEYVDDYKCEKCRLVYARNLLEAQLSRSTDEAFKETARQSISKIQSQIDTDPETPPSGVALPELRHAPTSRIAKHTRLTVFPKVLAIHLSRSIFDSHTSQKNSAKVSFPEKLSIGGLLSQKKYKLLGVVTHKGSHNSGHYESFRRQNVNLPYATTNTFQPSGIYTPSANVTPITSPNPSATPTHKSTVPSPMASTSDLVSGPSADVSSPATNTPPRISPSSSKEKESDTDTLSLRSVAASARSTVTRLSQSARNGRAASPSSKSKNATVDSSISNSSRHRRRKPNNRWWRISDDKIKEAKTSEVLDMQREVYMLFYELEREDTTET